MSKIKVTIFEGIDGSGKTTLAKAHAKAHKAHYISFPTCKPPEFDNKEEAAKWFLKDMQDALDTFLLWNAVTYTFTPDFYQRGKVQKGVERTSLQHDHIVLDRSFLSTVAYQGEVFDSGCNLTKYILKAGIAMFEEHFEVVDVIIPETTPLEAAHRIQKRGAKDDELDMIEDLGELVARLEKYDAAFRHLMDLIKF